jgi:hypothetical protein
LVQVEVTFISNFCTKIVYFLCHKHDELHHSTPLQTIGYIVGSYGVYVFHPSGVLEPANFKNQN